MVEEYLTTRNDQHIEMNIEQRKILAPEQIIWIGNMANNCTATWAGLILQAEWLHEDKWWWGVYDIQEEKIMIEEAAEYDEIFINGNAARQKAEAVAKQYLVNITQQIVARYMISDVFNITGRGLVLTGNIIEGSILPGYIIEFKALGKILQRTITGVERATSKINFEVSFGLLIRCESETEIKELRSWRFQNEPAMIYRSDLASERVPG